MVISEKLCFLLLVGMEDNDRGLYRFKDARATPDPFLTLPTDPGPPPAIVVDNGKSHDHKSCMIYRVN